MLSLLLYVATYYGGFYGVLFLDSYFIREPYC